MDEDFWAAYRKRVRERVTRRENGRLALVLVPMAIATTILWISQYEGYQPGDWRGDLAARALFGLVFIAFFVAGGIAAVRRWRRLERVERGDPD